MRHTNLLIYFLLAGLIALTACAPDGGAGDPATTVIDYLDAKISSDRDTLSQLLCAEMEGALDREVMSFDGVEARLENAACRADTDAGRVTCSGSIMATYGGEDTDFPLGTYRIVQEAGTWKWCGEVQ